MSAAAAPPHSDGEDDEEYRRPPKRLKTAARQTEEREEGEDELEEGEDSDSGSLPGEGQSAVDHRARWTSGQYRGGRKVKAAEPPHFHPVLLSDYQRRQTRACVRAFLFRAGTVASSCVGWFRVLLGGFTAQLQPPDGTLRIRLFSLHDTGELLPAGSDPQLRVLLVELWADLGQLLCSQRVPRDGAALPGCLPARPPGCPPAEPFQTLSPGLIKPAMRLKNTKLDTIQESHPHNQHPSMASVGRSAAEQGSRKSEVLLVRQAAGNIITSLIRLR